MARGTVIEVHWETGRCIDLCFSFVANAKSSTGLVGKWLSDEFNRSPEFLRPLKWFKTQLPTKAVLDQHVKFFQGTYRDDSAAVVDGNT